MATRPSPSQESDARSAAPRLPQAVLITGASGGIGRAVGLAFAGVKAVICKSVNRIFYRSSVNQGLPIILLPGAVDAYQPCDNVEIDFTKGIVSINNRNFTFAPLPEKLMGIFKSRGLVNYIKEQAL